MSVTAGSAGGWRNYCAGDGPEPVDQARLRTGMGTKRRADESRRLGWDTERGASCRHCVITVHSCMLEEEACIG